jgi:hypothetical protein
MATALPYGLRDVKLTPYTDPSGMVLSTNSLDLPNARTFSFSESEEFEQLRGDDRVVTTRGQGAMVEWELESGGLSLEIWKAMTGGQIIESGVAPNRQKIFRKRGRDSRPWFRIEGQAISDSGGDMHGIVYRCRVTEEMEGEFNDGEFFLTSGSGEGYPLLDDVDDILYDFVQNETATAIPTTGASNPTTAAP